MKEETKIIHAGRNPKEQGWMVNPPIHQSSTIAFPSYEEFLYADKGYSYTKNVKPYELKYGRYGTQTSFALEKAIAELENGYNSIVTCGGASAINSTMMAFVENGDHILMVDNVYFPTRQFCEVFLKKFGITTTYYDPYIGDGIKKLIQKNTKIIFMESPGSLTFEIQDIDKIVKIAKENNIVTIIDNCWASSYYFKPLNHGVDVSVIAATKYINGHSDVMMGAITMKEEKLFHPLYRAFRYSGITAAPYNAYLVQRGLRTLALRMERCFKSALKIAQWLESKKEVVKVFYPALKSNKSHDLWKKYFTGAAGLLSFALDKKYSDQALAEMINNLKLYAIGYSWGGYESLIMPFDAAKSRTVNQWQYSNNSCFRISIGLEDADDLIADLDQGLTRLKKY